jgi:2-iminobutanoate/2-iminopropanoate deaminase
VSARIRWLGAIVLAGAAGCASSAPDTTHLHADKPLGPYSGSVLSGDLCFVSGQIGPRGGTFEAEAGGAIDALQKQLARAGLTLSDLVQVTVYLTDMDDYGAFNRVYAGRVGEPYPARAVVEVAALPGEARVEIQAVARRGALGSELE